MLREHRRIRGLPPLAGGHQRLDRKIIIGAGSPARPGVRTDQGPRLRSPGTAATTRVRTEELLSLPCSAGVHTTVGTTVACTAVGDPIPPDRGDFLAVPGRLCGYSGVPIERRPGPAEQPGPEPVDVEPVRRFTDVVLGEVLPTFLRHASHLRWVP